MVMRRDFDYWGIDELLLEPCCALKFYPKVELCNTQIEKDIQDKEKAEKDRLAEDFGDSKISELRYFPMPHPLVPLKTPPSEANFHLKMSWIGRKLFYFCCMKEIDHDCDEKIKMSYFQVFSVGIS